MITHLDDDTFKKAIVNEKRLIIVDFSAKWCMPCKMLRKVLEEISEQYTNIKVFSIDVDESPMISNYFKVQSIPTLIFIKNGKLVDEVVGFSSKDYIQEIIEDNL